MHNACYWTATVAKRAVRRIALFLNADERRILIADSGPGIHEEAQEHMFDPFFTMKAGGKGLGLYISAELAANFGGQLRLASDEERLSLPDWVKGAVMVLEFTPAVTSG